MVITELSIRLVLPVSHLARPAQVIPFAYHVQLVTSSTNTISVSALAQVDNTEEPPLDTANLVGLTPTMEPTVLIPALLDTMETPPPNNVSDVPMAVLLVVPTLSALAVLQDSTSTP